MRYSYITQKAKTPRRNWTNKETAQFHYFNPNGLCAEWFAACDRVADIVERGLVPNGWVVAYGSLADYDYINLHMLATSGDVVRRVKLAVAIKMMRDRITKIHAKVDEVLDAQ